MTLTRLHRLKSLGPDRWMLEFFEAFYDLFGSDFLVAIEERRQRGSIPGEMNFNFIELIPKCSKPMSFE